MGIGVTVVMVVVECLEAGLSTLIKAAMVRGMNDLVFISYGNALGLVFLFSASIFFHIKTFSLLPQLTSPILLRILLLAQLRYLGQFGANVLFSSPTYDRIEYTESLQVWKYEMSWVRSVVCLNYGIWYSSPTLASALLDLTPAFTFLLALASRMEKLDKRAKSCWAKSIGTIVSISGALIVSLYKGLPVTKPSLHHTNTNLLHNHQHVNDDLILSTESSWAIGGFLVAFAALSLSLLYIVQTWIMRDYPHELLVTLICCIFVTIESTIIASLTQRDPKAWVLKQDIELITIVYGAFFAIAIRSVVHTWACRKKGPVYVSMFKPLSMVAALIMGVSFLGDTLYLGSLIGAAIIAIGFYSVIWGQAQEEKKVLMAKESTNKTYGIDEESSPRVPLLNTKNLDT